MTCSSNHKKKFKVNQLVKKENIALKANATQEENDDENQEIDSRRKYCSQSSRRILLKEKIVSIVVKLGISQLIVQTRKKTNMARRKDKEEKNGQAYFVEWNSDASSNEDDDDKPSRGLARVAIKEAPSLFSKPYCLMATYESKVKVEDDDDD
jgi:hypothetical protein